MPISKAEKNLDLPPTGNTQIKKKLSIVQISLISILITLILLIALPGYLVGQWSWSDLPKVAGINKLKSLETKGLTLPDWPTLSHKRFYVGTNKWTYQTLALENEPKIQLFLLPQGYYKNNPEVEWIDIDGFERWQKNEIQTLEFKSTAGNTIRSRFFKAGNYQTYAVVQWYAWLGGGDYEVFPWFKRDEIAQIKGQRVPWIAVSFKILMNPLAELEQAQALAQKLAESIQNILEQEVFANSNN